MDNIGSLLWDAVTLMVTGMGFVFLFLTILVYLVTLMAKLVPQEEPAVTSVPSKKMVSTPQSDSSISPQVIAAISAAVRQYRSSAEK